MTETGGTVPAGVEAIPIINDPSIATPSNLALIQSKYKTFVGYNEPPTTLDLDTAVSSWSDMYNTGLRAGCPAPAHTTLEADDRFVKFMDTVTATGQEPDVICLYYYSGIGTDWGWCWFKLDHHPGVSKMQSYIQSVYEKYNLPIWATEMAMIDWRNWPVWSAPPGNSTQGAYMQAVTAILDGLSYVERHAWSALDWHFDQQGSGLYDTSGTVTDVGLAFKAISM
ncbi:hypothetical protein MMC28_005900 [Mycoblastus sanguinarius]|nr:hypothetical protein [Mycoblastus sanguinarius]